MKAVFFENYGLPKDQLKYSDIPLPKFGPSEVIIRVHASALNPVDYKLLTGGLSLIKPLQNWPLICGFDFLVK